VMISDPLLLINQKLLSDIKRGALAKIG